jgi:hypothetical protein
MLDDLDEFGDGRWVEDPSPLDEVYIWKGVVVVADFGSVVMMV